MSVSNFGSAKSSSGSSSSSTTPCNCGDVPTTLHSTGAVALPFERQTVDPYTWSALGGWNDCAGFNRPVNVTLVCDGGTWSGFGTVTIDMTDEPIDVSVEANDACLPDLLVTLTAPTCGATVIHVTA